MGLECGFKSLAKLRRLVWSEEALLPLCLGGDEGVPGADDVVTSCGEDMEAGVVGTNEGERTGRI